MRGFLGKIGVSALICSIHLEPFRPFGTGSEWVAENREQKWERKKKKREKGVTTQFMCSIAKTNNPLGCIYYLNSHCFFIRHKPGLAAFVGCMMPMMLGVCFLCPSMDCLWHKYHYCPSCNEKVADFEKSDPCLVMDPSQWTQESFALPA
ncbi:GSH-induced LITAF domain protein-like [Olea europaea var. sylvestris]|uniref:GSH-induced LITAF domain protein-like n=1 Tax=Olea europaea var. sylvestris TaxID=158386 RepID=UPI000C1D6079|nr:GSH-induced LITAF domain protein-like [Olea europaea var. sylvestris]